MFSFTTKQGNIITFQNKSKLVQPWVEHNQKYNNNTKQKASQINQN